MAHYVDCSRDTALFVSGSLEDLLPEDSVARVIWAGLEQLDFAAYDALHNNDTRGRSALHPRCLAAVWILAILRGVTSSVRLAKLCGRDIEFGWLLGDTPVQKSTLCDFRKQHMEALVSLSTQVLGALGHKGLLPGENMGVDGSIVRAASSRHAVKSRKGLERQKKHPEALIAEKLSQEDCEGESEEMKALERRQQRVAQALEEMNARGLTEATDRLTVTEPDASLTRQKDGSFAPGYTTQAAPDLDSGAILHSQVVDAGGDGGQLKPQFEGAQAVLEKVKGGDAPAGIHAVAADGAYGEACHACPAKSQCCPKTKQGRCVNRSLHTETLDTVAQRVDSEEGRPMKAARSIACEGAFARLKDLLHWPRCRMWGHAGAEMELLWRQFIHNLMLLTGVWKPIVARTAASG